MREHGFVEGTNGITYVHKKDERRHRKWCIHYHKDGSCAYMSKCGGSAQCGFYEEGERDADDEVSAKLIASDAPTKKDTGTLQKYRAEEFEGIRMIRVADIVVPGIFHDWVPNEKKVENLCVYYNKHKKLDKPVYVIVKKGKYYLEDKYLRYYVAKKLGLTTIEAKIGTYKDSSKNDRISNEGSKIRHRKYGKGVVTESDGKYVTVLFDSGEEKKFDLELCIKNGILSVDN